MEDVNRESYQRNIFTAFISGWVSHIEMLSFVILFVDLAGPPGGLNPILNKYKTQRES